MNEQKQQYIRPTVLTDESVVKINAKDHPDLVAEAIINETFVDWDGEEAEIKIDETVQQIIFSTVWSYFLKSLENVVHTYSLATVLFLLSLVTGLSEASVSSENATQSFLFSLVLLVTSSAAFWSSSGFIQEERHRAHKKETRLIELNQGLQDLTENGESDLSLNFQKSLINKAIFEVLRASRNISLLFVFVLLASINLESSITIDHIEVPLIYATFIASLSSLGMYLSQKVYKDSIRRRFVGYIKEDATTTDASEKIDRSQRLKLDESVDDAEKNKALVDDNAVSKKSK